MRRARTKAVGFFSAFIGRMPVSSMQQSGIERHCGVVFFFQMHSPHESSTRGIERHYGVVAFTRNQAHSVVERALQTKERYNTKHGRTTRTII